MRLFVAIDVPDSLKEVIKEVQDSLNLPGLKKVDLNQTHLTLAFYKDGEAEKVIEKVKKIRFKPFYIHVKGFGLFPGLKNPKVLWLGIEDNENLNELKQFIQPGNFVPHITIARMKNVDSQEIVRKMREQNVNYKFKVDNIKLYSSKKTEIGRVHNVVDVFESEKHL